MSEFSLPWPDTSSPGPTVGDGRPYTDTEWSTVWRLLFAQAEDSLYCLAKNVWDELAVTSPSANLARVAAGAAVLYGHIYWSDATVDLSVNSAPAGNVRWDRVILRGTWLPDSNQYRVRLFIKEGTSAAPPALTQVVNSTYEMSLYKYQVDDAGTITQITKEAYYLRFATEVGTSMVTDGLLDHGNLTGLTDDDHTQYYNTTRHTKAVHDALDIGACTLDGLHATDFQRVDDAAQTDNLSDIVTNWNLPSSGVWSVITFNGNDRINLNLNGYCDVMMFFDANMSGPVGGDVWYTCWVDGSIEQEQWARTDAGTGVQHLNGHWMVKSMGPGAHYFQIRFKRSGTWGPVMQARKFSVLVVSKQL